jgi:6-pyruvoyltetrahydropterin/6-carboxytetrahydropterin synthase
MIKKMEEKITLTRKFEFSASHRFWNDKWSEEKNYEIFGKNAGPYGHGHNYNLFVTISGPVSGETGMIINLSQLKKIVNEVLQDFDHKFLNMDTPFFKDIIPTTENVADVLFNLIEKKLETFQYIILKRIRLHVKEDVFAEVWRKD